MKTPLKALLFTTLALIAVPLIAWTGTFLYWQFRIKSALRPLQQPLPPIQRKAPVASTAELNQTLLDAGCRALPCLVRAQAEAENEFVYYQVMSKIISCLSDLMPYGEERERKLNDWLSRWLAYPPERGWKAARSDFEKWWSANGASYHHWWRVWSSNCSDVR